MNFIKKLKSKSISKPMLFTWTKTFAEGDIHKSRGQFLNIFDLPLPFLDPLLFRS